MQSASQGAAGARLEPLPVAGRGERRRRYRRPFHSLAYVKLGSENGGILRDISDHGAALQAVAPLEQGEIVQMRFELLGANGVSPRTRLDVEGRVVWALDTGQAGVEFPSLSAASRRQLNEWVLGGLLVSIAQLSPVLTTADPLDDENLMLAPGGRASIALPSLEPAPRRSLASDEDLLLDWLLDRVSPRALSYAVDALVLCVAVLLFLVVALAVAQTLPAWQGALATGLGVLCFCGVLYRWLFRFLGTQTAGRWLADLAVRTWEAEHQSSETMARFR